MVVAQQKRRLLQHKRAKHGKTLKRLPRKILKVGNTNCVNYDGTAQNSLACEEALDIPMSGDTLCFIDEDTQASIEHVNMIYNTCGLTGLSTHPNF